MSIKSVLAVSRFLNERHFNAPKSTIDRHFKEGKFGRNKDGEFEEKVLLEYARVHLKEAETGKKREQVDLDRARAKSDAEIQKLQEQGRLARIKRQKLEKKVVPRGLYEKDLAARMAFFSSQLDALFPRLADECVQLFIGENHGRAAQLIDLVDGDHDKAMELVGYVEKMVPELIAVFMNRKARWLEAFARDRVHVVELEGYLQEEEERVSV